MLSFDNSLYIAEIKRILRTGQKSMKYKDKLMRFQKVNKKHNKTFITPQEFKALISSDLDSVRFDRWMTIIRRMLKDSGYTPIRTGFTLIPIVEESSDYPFDYELEGTGIRFWHKDGEKIACVNNGPKLEAQEIRFKYSTILETIQKGNTVNPNPDSELLEFDGSIWRFSKDEAIRALSKDLECQDKEFREYLISLDAKLLIDRLIPYRKSEL